VGKNKLQNTALDPSKQAVKQVRAMEVYWLVEGNFIICVLLMMSVVSTGRLLAFLKVLLDG
jgi:hypothetical protein